MLNSESHAVVPTTVHHLSGTCCPEAYINNRRIDESCAPRFLLLLIGSVDLQLGDRVRCDAIPEHNSQYKWRITRVYVDPSTPGAAGAIPPPR
jgi:hypothetical protein